MGILQSMLRLIQGGEPLPPTLSGLPARPLPTSPAQPRTSRPEARAIPAREGIPHWPASEAYAVDAVGEAFYRDAIRSLVGNTAGERLLTYCTALLVPEAHNPHDANAVAVHVGGAKVAHLSRDHAIRHREALRSSGMAGAVTSCDAVISGGVFWEDHSGYDYSVQLDFPVGGQLRVGAVPTFPTPKQEWDEARVTNRFSAEDVLIEVPHADRDVLNMCGVFSRLTAWSKAELEEVHLFAPGSIGGTGRVGVFGKAMLPNWEDLAFWVHSISGRVMTIRAARTCDQRIACFGRPSMRVLLVGTDASDSAPDTLAARLVEVDRTKSTFARLVDAVGDDTQEPRTKLAELVQGADLLIARDAERAKRAVDALLPQYKGIWVSAAPYLGEDATPGSGGAAKDCEVLITRLFAHRGKTKRSYTHMAALIDSVLKGVSPNLVVG